MGVARQMASQTMFFNKATRDTVVLNESGPTRKRENLLMAIYEVEQYEIHAFTYRIEAESEAEAIAKLFDGDAQPTGNGPEYVEVAEDFGLPVDEYRELAEELEARGITVGEVVIPSICSIRSVSREESPTS